MRPLIAAMTAGMALALVASSQAQVLGVEILVLDCAGNPEVVTIRNMAHSAQNLAGWTLQSDSGESFDLGLEVGGLDPVHEGGQISVYSNSQAPATNPAQWQYRWTTAEVFRDGDGTDFVRLIDGTGGVVAQQNCSQQPAPEEPTPSPSPAAPQPQPGVVTPSPPDAPQVARAVAQAVAQPRGPDVFGPPAPLAARQQLPESGGRPPSTDGLPLAAVLLSLGIAAVAAGAELLALSRQTRS